MAESKKPAKKAEGKAKAKTTKPHAAKAEAKPEPAETKAAATEKTSAEHKAKTTEAVPKPAKKAAQAKKEQPAAATPPPENLSLSNDNIEPVKVVKAKGSKNVHSGIAHVLSTFNNTIVTITDLTGKVIGWSSAGKVGFKGSRKSTAYAAQMVAQDAS